MTQSDRASLLWKGSPASDREIDQLLHPSRFYTRPSDVLADHLLTVEERRAILSSWASDACGVESNPALRQPPHASEPVTFDEIMDALLQLDRLPSQDTESRRRRRRQNARAGVNPPAYPSSSLSSDIKISIRRDTRPAGSGVPELSKGSSLATQARADTGSTPKNISSAWSSSDAARSLAGGRGPNR
jgi:hypothetical protein